MTPRSDPSLRSAATRPAAPGRHTPKLPRSLRRSADRPAVPRGHPPQRLLDAAEVGLLTRRNTSPGTAGRQAADRATYLSRASRRRPGENVREALGHERPSVRAGAEISVLLDRPDPWTVLEAPTRLEKTRAARYDALVSNLVQGKISSRAFRRRVDSWVPIRGERWLSDADRVMAVLEGRRAAGEDLFIYRSGRAA
ncbi:MAG: hypothetical protein ACLPR9_04515 [Acidimicrobiales bacterium]